ncbi:hypothetical protein GF351_03335 [Candidatus Woesearchaeota archaeon]|nr:hypothetical protein [Candidatus Woesearchaeota archaeon]
MAWGNTQQDKDSSRRHAWCFSGVDDRYSLALARIYENGLPEKVEGTQMTALSRSHLDAIVDSLIDLKGHMEKQAGDPGIAVATTQKHVARIYPERVIYVERYAD